MDYNSNSYRKTEGFNMCNWLDLQTLGSQLIMLKNLPNPWWEGSKVGSHQPFDFPHLKINFISWEETAAGPIQVYTLAPKSNLVVHSLGLGYDPGPTNAKHGMDKGMDKY